MKRFLALILALVLAFTLAACSPSAVQSMMQDRDPSSSDRSDRDDDDRDDNDRDDNDRDDGDRAESTPSLVLPTPQPPEVPSTGGSYIGRPEDDEDWPHIDDPTYFEGRMGDHMRNIFFEYTVNSVDYPQSYQGITASAGNQLVVANVSVKNVWGENIDMLIYDFQIQWEDDDDDDDYDFGYQVKHELVYDEKAGETSPSGEKYITVDDYNRNIVVGNMMPYYYELKRAQTMTYDIVYEVPAEATEFSISYLETWSDDSTSDVFFVYFEK